MARDKKTRSSGAAARRFWTEHMDRSYALLQSMTAYPTQECGEPLAPRPEAAHLLPGVDIQGWPGAPVSAAHNLRDMEKTVEAFQQTIKQLQTEGELD